MAVILWMVLIFNLSSQVAEESNQLSTGITEIIVKTIERVVPQAEFDMGSFNHIVRKNAHFFAYLVLGVLVMNALKKNRACGFQSVLSALAICVFYAVSDEVHQLFVPGRGGQVKDVIIDSFGASIGLAIYLLGGKLFERKSKKN